MNEVRMTVIRRKDTGEFLTRGVFKNKWKPEFHRAKLYSTMGAQDVLQHYKDFGSSIELEAVSIKLTLEGVKDL